MKKPRSLCENTLLCLLTVFFAGASTAAAPFAQKPGQGNPGKGTDAESHFSKWLNEDVVYIITPEERDVFLKLTTDEERERFVEQFWARRDPNPEQPGNEFREEHYRRVQYANQHFPAGIPGWKTDRGRIYIAYGPPDRIESHPVGGQYLRPQHEGGGQTSTYPFERWEYRHIEGIGEDIEIEFVDVSGGNLYKIATNPFEKDELLYVPGMGLTDRERMPGPGDDPEDLRRSRVLGIRDAGSARRMGIYGERAKYSPFARTELAANLSKPPLIRFKDLQADVTARVSYDAIPINLSYHAVRLGGSEALVPMVMSVPSQALSFRQEGDLAVNRLQVYGRITSLTGRLVYEFDDEILLSYPTSGGREPDGTDQKPVLYRRPLALRHGTFKLDAVIREASSNKMGSASLGLSIPDFSDAGQIQITPIVLARDLDGSGAGRLTGSEYLLGQFRIRPNPEQAYHTDDYLALYCEIYDYAQDAASGEGSLKVEYAIVPEGNSEPVSFRDISRGIIIEPDRVLVPRQVSLAAYQPGDYRLQVRVTDQISGKSAGQTTSFRIQ